MLIALHKPFGVMCQFSDRTGSGGPTLADYISSPDVYPAGRLDKNSEGLLLLTDDGALQHEISHPQAKTAKEYWVQLEGKPESQFAQDLCRGTVLADGKIAADAATALSDASRKHQIALLGPHPGQLPEHRAENSSWYSVTLSSGRNRIVRRLCAAMGHPVLRLVRVRIGPIELGKLRAGESHPEQWHRPVTKH